MSIVYPPVYGHIIFLFTPYSHVYNLYVAPTQAKKDACPKQVFIDYEFEWLQLI